MALEQQFLAQFQALVQNVSQLVQKTGSVPVLPNYTVAQAQALALTGIATGTSVYVTNETGGAQGASFDGAAFRRFSDRAIIS